MEKFEYEMLESLLVKLNKVCGGKQISVVNNHICDGYNIAVFDNNGTLIKQGSGPTLMQTASGLTLKNK